MIKRIITIFLAFIFLFSALPSCSEVTGEGGTPETTLPVPETSEEIPEEPVLRSFYAREAGYKQGYVVLRPEEGSKIAEEWHRIYVTNYSDGELCPRPMENEIIEITYSGEIEAMPETPDDPPGYTIGYIKEVHSMKIKVEPREYNGINCGLAVLEQGVSGETLEKHGGTAIQENQQFGKRIEGIILATNRDELTYLADNCFMQKFIPSGHETDQMKESFAQFNQRYRLLDGYDEAFFNENDLVMISIWAGSGSMRFDVTDIMIDSGICTLTVEITEMPGTNDINTWMFLVSIPKEVSATITEYKTYTPKPAWER